MPAKYDAKWVHGTCYVFDGLKWQTYSEWQWSPNCKSPVWEAVTGYEVREARCLRAPESRSKQNGAGI